MEAVRHTWHLGSVRQPASASSGRSLAGCRSRGIASLMVGDVVALRCQLAFSLVSDISRAETMPRLRGRSIAGRWRPEPRV